ncbi:phage baseplate assembly protein V [Flavobacterium sp. LS1R47]|jgi:type VI secretion system secreted protein VgrG|uniref:Phage baseplate assembly protein V n=1 Tax=Flavobacterium frigoritolerans TaxID=2987686 RepID=A0A9X2ZL59_9FLAO|nr:phage baseplate assembly protein V [Flavobacterium frigoritolerans]MCV9930651.1 phage baseplate assembly protein V [Flavobacterium frigoritolerans]
MTPPTIIFGIDSKKISHFTSIELVQEINGHHQFTITVPHSVVESPLAYTLENAQGWLGKVVHIILEEKNNFLGVVTNIDFDQQMGHSGNHIIVSGYSKTILLESGEKLYSWEELTLKDIVKEVVKNGAGEQLQNEINPEYATKMDYQNQHLETDFQFIQRLAKQYNEWLYYDGEKLIFGKPKSFDDPISLTYNTDISKLKISVQAVPNKFSAFTYNESTDKRYTAKSKDTVAGLPKLGNEAFASSKEVFATPAYTHGIVSTGDDLVLESFLKKKQESAASNANYINASTKNSKLKIGSIVNIQSSVLENASMVTQEVGSYIITEITHYATHLGEYENNFRAIPSKVLGLPEPDVAYPIAQTQQAVVESNTDPKNKGRIRVQMLWQQGTSMKTAWLRVMTPDAGSSDKVGTNRGMVFIPDVGDHVMVHFRYGDPNRPFILGSVFHGKSGGGGGKDNNQRSFATRGGTSLVLDEEKNTFTASDPSGNMVKLNGDGTMTFFAPNKIDIQSKEINLIADEKVNIDGVNEVNISSKKVLTTGTDEVTVKSDTQITDEAPSINIKGKNTILAEGMVVDIDGKTMTNVKGGIVNLN